MERSEKKRWNKRQEQELKITALIEKEVSYFNGWYVDPSSVTSACRKAAEKIMRYYVK